MSANNKSNSLDGIWPDLRFNIHTLILLIICLHSFGRLDFSLNDNESRKTVNGNSVNFHRDPWWIIDELFKRKLVNGWDRDVCVFSCFCVFGNCVILSSKKEWTVSGYEKRILNEYHFHQFIMHQAQSDRQNIYVIQWPILAKRIYCVVMICMF